MSELARRLEQVLSLLEVTRPLNDAFNELVAQLERQRMDLQRQIAEQERNNTSTVVCGDINSAFPDLRMPFSVV